MSDPWLIAMRSPVGSYTPPLAGEPPGQPGLPTALVCAAMNGLGHILPGTSKGVGGIRALTRGTLGLADTGLWSQGPHRVTMVWGGTVTRVQMHLCSYFAWVHRNTSTVEVQKEHGVCA